MQRERRRGRRTRHADVDGHVAKAARAAPSHVPKAPSKPRPTDCAPPRLAHATSLAARRLGTSRPPEITSMLLARTSKAAQAKSFGEKMMVKLEAKDAYSTLEEKKVEISAATKDGRRLPEVRKRRRRT